ncbi:MAG: hypothetical protein ACJ790_06445 [Myxococcaceae bacterium]
MQRLLQQIAVIVVLAVAMACECGGHNPPRKPDSGASEDAAVADSGSDAGDDGGSSDADAGSNDGGTDAGNRADAGVPIENLCGELTAAWCDRLLGCGELDPAQRSDCPELISWVCSQDQLSSLARDGSIGFDPQHARACIDGIRAVPCGPELPGAAACDDLFASQTPNGGSCSRQTNACANGYCDGADCSATCAPYLALDAGCTGAFGDECGPAAHCQSGRCTPFLLPGQACAPNDACLGGLCDPGVLRCVEYGSLGADAGCVSEAECIEGLACIDSVCQPRHRIAQSCRIYGGTQCDSDFTCRSFDGGLSGICWPRSDAGESCFGVPEDCYDRLLCSSTALFSEGSCLERVGEDAGCNRVVQNCRFGLVCGPDSRCHRLPHVSESCAADPFNFRSSDCVAGFCDDRGDGGVCRGPQDAGQSCGRPWECASNVCAGGACAVQCL